ncbi:LysR substrate-binding domain-containing protein [Coralliovum pocilloporae]|uniref:LysR substrate-binding domain-containing protein n=1 Tax=Coralliovum pocilloporae TaxID=3066369 RepID=UPI003307584B
MGRSLPPFAALRAFEAAARHCSFKRAAVELSLSPSAISHQIKSLEDYLGVCLFIRNQNKLALTDMARNYLEPVSQALNLLEEATSRIEDRRDEASLSINLFPSFAEIWLIPRLAEYRRQNPDVSVKLITTYEPIPFAGSEVDLAITYTEDPDPQHPSALLFEEEIVPVCSPDYLADFGPVETPADLAKHTMIICTNHPGEWDRWLAVHQVPESRPQNHVDVEGRSLAMRAAQDSLGIAIGRTPYADDALQSGALVKPFDSPVKTGRKYYLTWPERKAKFRNVKSFRSWVMEKREEMLLAAAQ